MRMQLFLSSWNNIVSPRYLINHDIATIPNDRPQMKNKSIQEINIPIRKDHSCNQESASDQTPTTFEIPLLMVNNPKYVRPLNNIFNVQDRESQNRKSNILDHCPYFLATLI